MSKQIVMRADEVRAHEAKDSKYHNKKVELDGYIFDSRIEYERYLWLKDEQAAGRIHGLEVHTTWNLFVNHVLVGNYTPDFEYDVLGTWVVEDVKVKPTRTAVYMLKKRLMLACHGITVQEWPPRERRRKKT